MGILVAPVTPLNVAVNWGFVLSPAIVVWVGSASGLLVPASKVTLGTLLGLLVAAAIVALATASAVCVGGMLVTPVGGVLVACALVAVACGGFVGVNGSVPVGLSVGGGMVGTVWCCVLPLTPGTLNTSDTIITSAVMIQSI
jgi:hypothetical protein